MPETTKLAQYLFKRLQQLGVGSIHGVPGDYNLTLLDYVEPSGLHWVGSCNELNAGYAADGYAKVKGIGALITTFGVGELSAINAIAGAYTERAALVHIVGTPARASQDARLKIHHTFNDGNYRRFGQMAAHVTVAQISLRDPRLAPEQVDDILIQCLLHSRPVYIEVPVDLVDATVSSDRLESKLQIPKTLHTPGHDKAIAAVLEKIRAAKQPMIYVDGEARALGILDEVSTFIERTQWPTWTSSFARGLIDESLPNANGIYRGSYDSPEAQDFFKSADLVVVFGPHFSSTNSYAYTSIPRSEVTVSFTDTDISIGDQVYRDIPAKHALSLLLKQLDSSKVKTYDRAPEFPASTSAATFSSVSSDQTICQDALWPLFGNFLQPGDLVFGETGTASYGIRLLPLPKHARMFTSVTWLSIGYMLPATQGAALAQKELVASGDYKGLKSGRAILFIGDGSFQMTAQELSTIIREKLDIMIFLINNDGYTIERCIHGLKEGYNDIAPWKYLQLSEAFGAENGTYTASAKTYGELEKALSDEKLSNGKGLRMVELFLEREDAPKGPLIGLMEKQKAAVNGA